jgi:hypothetical protein
MCPLLNMSLAIRLHQWYVSHMSGRPSDRSMPDEQALLRVLGASRRAASLKAVVARYKRGLPPVVVVGPPATVKAVRTAGKKVAKRVSP